MRSFTFWSAIALALCLSACGGSDATTVELRVDSAGDAPAPRFLTLGWLDEKGFLFRDRRIPDDGFLGQASPLAKIRIDVTGTGMRRAVVRGWVDEDVVSEGTATMMVAHGGINPASLILNAGQLPDRDMDGAPDEIDGCPDDGQETGPCPGADGGAPPDGPPDVAPPPPDGPPADGGVDAPPPSDGGVDGPPDGPPPPPPDAPPGVDAGRDLPAGEVPLDVPVMQPTAFPCGTILFVTSSVNTANDRLLVARLTGLGCTVNQQSDGTLAASQANGKTLAVVSDTTDAALVKNVLRGVAVPLLILKPELLDDNSFTAGVDGTDWARSSTEALVQIGDPPHPAAGGLTGVVSINTMPFAVGWGKPEPTGTAVAFLVGNPSRAVLLAYERDTQMSGGFRAPARRAAYLIHLDGPPKLNGNGWVLFDATVRWLTGH